MATIVQSNPFDTQPAQGSNQGIVGGAINNVTTGTTAASQDLAQYNPVSNLSVQSYTPQTREVDKATETTAGQVESLLAKDNPLMQRARTLALQNMNKRGLVNSSMSQGAGVAAMVDRITPIAQSDAQTYSTRALANMDATNEANQFNVGQNNSLVSQGLNIASQFGLQDKTQKFETAERQASQAFQTGEREASQTFQSYESLLQREFTAVENNLNRTQQMRIAELQEAGADRRQAEQVAAQERAQKQAQAFEAAQAKAAQAFQEQQNAAQRAQEQALAQAQIQANKDLQAAQQAQAAAQAALDRAQQAAIADKSLAAQQAAQAAQLKAAETQAALDRAQQAKLAAAQLATQQQMQLTTQQFQATQAALDRENQVKLTQLQDSINDANVSASFAASTAQNTLSTINAIQADGNLSSVSDQADGSSPKSRAIDNVIAVANSTIQWGSTFYNTTLPTIAAPGNVAGVVTPGAGAGTTNTATSNTATNTAATNTASSNNAAGNSNTANTGIVQNAITQQQTAEPEQSGAYRWAEANGGVDAMYSRIGDFLASNPSPEEIAVAATTYQISQDDYAEAQRRLDSRSVNFVQDTA